MKTVTCIDKDEKTYEVPASELAWRPSVYGIIIQDDKILLSPQFDGYDLPGWGIELWESIENALIREIREETGYDARVGSLVSAHTSLFRLPREGEEYVHSIMMYYTASIIGWSLSIDWFDEWDRESKVCKLHRSLDDNKKSNFLTHHLWKSTSQEKSQNEIMTFRRIGVSDTEKQYD
jgi:ADP-ribose pyrophosphatase YjhB (NUDIX family)